MKVHVWPAVRIVVVTALAALLLVALPGTGRGDHEGPWPPEWTFEPHGWTTSETHRTANHVCGITEKVKIRVWVKATQDPPFVLWHQGYNTTGTFNNGNKVRHNQTTYTHVMDNTWTMGPGWWLVNTLTFPEGKIANDVLTDAQFDFEAPPPGTVWLYHQKRCV